MVLSFTHLSEFMWRLQRNDPDDHESHLVLDGRGLDRMMNKVDFAGDDYVDLVYAVRENATVTKVTLCHYRETYAPLGDLFAKFGNLQSLSCFDCSPPAVKRLLKMANRIRELQILCKNPTSQYLSVVASSIRRHPSLERVHFLCQWPEEARNVTANIDEVVVAAASIPNLRLVYFGSQTGGTKLRFGCYKSLKRLLQCPTLRELYLVRYMMSGKDCKVLASSLESPNCVLKVLHLTNLSFERPSDSVAIACAFQDNSSVLQLYLDHLKRAPAQFYLDLSLALQLSKTLAHLSLDNQDVADGAEEGLFEILMSLQTPGSSLKTISMNGNGFSDELVNSVSYLLRVNSTEGGMDTLPQYDIVGSSVETMPTLDDANDGTSRVSDITDCESRALSVSSVTSYGDQLAEEMGQDNANKSTTATASPPGRNRLSAVKRNNLSSNSIRSAVDTPGLTKTSSHGKRKLVKQRSRSRLRITAKSPSKRSVSPDTRKSESTEATEPTIIYEMSDDSPRRTTTDAGEERPGWRKRIVSALSPTPKTPSRLMELRRKRDDREQLLREALTTPAIG